MGMLALVCFIILLIMIPSDVWAALFYLAIVGFVGIVGLTALVLWATS